MGSLPIFLAFLLGAGVAGLAAWLLLRTRQEQITCLSTEKEELDGRLKDEGDLRQAAQVELARAIQRAERVDELQETIETMRRETEALRQEKSDLLVAKTEFEGKLEAEQRNVQEQKELLANAQNQLTDAFKAISVDVLKGNAEVFLNQAKEVLANQTTEANKHLEVKNKEIEGILKPLNEQLKEYQDKLQRLDVAHSARETETRKTMEELLRGLNDQRATTATLKGMIKGPTTRGRAGEILLRRMLEAAGLKETVHYDMQSSERTEAGLQRPDCIIRMPNERSVVIDCKAPLNYYEQAMDTEDDVRRQQLLKDHSNQLKRTIDELSKRKYEEHVRAEFTVMYLPFEASLNAALMVDPDIVSYGWDKRVIVTSPTLLYALLQIVSQSWREEEVRKNAEQIMDLGREMVDRIRVVAEHFHRVGHGLRAATEGYNNAVTSIERNLLTSAKRFKTLGVAKAVKVPNILPSPNDLRDIVKPELLEPVASKRVLELDKTADLFALELLEPVEEEVAAIETVS